MWKFNKEEDHYRLPNDYGEVEITQNEQETDDWCGFYNGEFMISGSLGEVARYMEGFVYGLDYYK